MAFLTPLLSFCTMADFRSDLALDQQLRISLSPQQLKFVRLLEMNAPELEDAVAKELEENVALEEKEAPSPELYSPSLYYRRNTDTEDSPIYTPPDREESIYENLLSQLSEKKLKPAVKAAAEYIIGNLDSNGYLERPLPLLMNDMLYNEGVDLSEEEGKEALEVVQSMEPAGIGAYNLRETLILQLERLPDSPTRNNALNILINAYDAFIKKHRHKIISRLRISEKDTADALNLIKSLNPRPGAAIGYDSSDEASVIIPDFNISVEDNNIFIALNNTIPELTIDESFTQAVASMERNARKRKLKGSEYILRNYNDAKDFINILNQRQATMMAVMSAIVKIQKEYFLTQDVYKLRPMMIKNVAELTGLDFSVISRATNGKYVSTPWGIFPLRFFFSETVGEHTDDSEALTNRKIEEEIKTIIAAENKSHPLSDQKVAQEMMTRGFDISRRTIAKYRDRLKIPVARLRKE